MLQRWRASPDASLKYQFHLMMILLFSLTTSFCLFLVRYKHTLGNARYLGACHGTSVDACAIRGGYYRNNFAHKS